ARRGALLLGLAAPEAVLAVLTRPPAAGLHHGAGRAHGAGLGLAHQPGLGTLACGGEEQLVLPSARGRAGPRERTGEDQIRDSFAGAHRATPGLESGGREIRGVGWGGSDSPTRPAPSILPPGADSGRQLDWLVRIAIRGV